MTEAALSQKQADCEALKAELATERAAREEAENEYEATLRDLDVRGQQLDGAVAAAADLRSELDTALARVKELEGFEALAEQWQRDQAHTLSRAEAAETALASARTAVTEAVKELESWVAAWSKEKAGGYWVDQSLEKLRTWLSSAPAPAPVAARKGGGL